MLSIVLTIFHLTQFLLLLYFASCSSAAAGGFGPVAAFDNAIRQRRHRRTPQTNSNNIGHDEIYVGMTLVSQAMSAGRASKM